VSKTNNEQKFRQINLSANQTKGSICVEGFKKKMYTTGKKRRYRLPRNSDWAGGNSVG